jgi:hypothetical protein
MGYAILTMVAFLTGFTVALVICFKADQNDEELFDSALYEARINQQLKYAKAKKTKK